MMCCPTCGHTLTAGLITVEGLLDLPTLTEQERRAVAALVDRYPRPVSRFAMLDAIWGDDPDGGPDAAAKNVHIIIHHIRRKLDAIGWTIPDARTGAGGVGQYRLVAREAT